MSALAKSTRAGRINGAREATQVVRLALTPAEAAMAIGCSRDFFDEHIGPELHWVRRGRLKFVPVKELDRWLSDSAAMVLGEGS